MRFAGLVAAVLALAGCCTSEAPARTAPPPPPPPPVYQPPPPPPPPPTYPQSQPMPPPQQPSHYHSATPIPGGAPMAVNAEQAQNIALQYASQRGFNVHKVQRVEMNGRDWEVELQGHPPTPGKLRVWVDSTSGAVVGDDSRPGEGHGHDHDDHEHGAGPPQHH